MAITISGSGITSANIADGTIVNADINSSVELGVTDAEKVNLKSGRKNLIINGGFDVSQRGDYKTSAVAAVSNAYSIDRWNTWKATVNATHQLQTATINGVLKNTFKITSSNTLTGHIGFNQRIETQDFPIGVNVTVSCWMKSNNSYARLRQNNVADFDSDSPKHSGNGSWEFMSWTLDTTGTLPTASSVNFGAICYESGNVALNVGDYIEVADFQVEVGSVATDFEHRSYGEELALCQRFYQDLGRLFVQGYGYSGGTDGVGSALLFSTTMRATPTLTKTNESHGGSYTSMVFNYSSKFGIGGLEAQTNNSTQNNWVHALVTADAEL